MNSSENRSSIIPSIRYNDATRAIEFLCEAFGFQKHLVVPGPDETIMHAQLTFGNSMIMLGSARDDAFGKLQAPLRDVTDPVSQSSYLIVSDVDAHHAQAEACGAITEMPPADQEHGGRFYACRDPEGNLWNFGSYDPWSEH